MEQKVFGELLYCVSQNQVSGSIEALDWKNLSIIDYLGESSTKELINKLISLRESEPEAPWWD